MSNRYRLHYAAVKQSLSQPIAQPHKERLHSSHKGAVQASIILCCAFSVKNITHLRRGVLIGKLLACLALEELDDLNNGNDQDSQYHCDAVLGQTNGSEAEGICQEGDLQDGGGQEQ